MVFLKVENWLNQLCEELSERIQLDLDQNKRVAHTLTLHAMAFKVLLTISILNIKLISFPLPLLSNMAAIYFARDTVQTHIHYAFCRKVTWNLTKNFLQSHAHCAMAQIKFKKMPKNFLILDFVNFWVPIAMHGE